MSITELEMEKIGGKRRSPFRAIQYLGSKMRLIDQIGDLVADLNPSSAPICDLFSGSGVVAHSLAKNYPVISVDIQKYSSEIASALLISKFPSIDEVEALKYSAANSSVSKALSEVFAPLIEFERRALNEAVSGAPDSLILLSESPSFYSLLQADRSKSELGSFLPEAKKALRRFKRLPEAIRNRALATSYFGGVYFSFEQTVEIDGLMDSFEKFADRRSALVAPLLSAMSEAVNTVGKQFAQPMRLLNKDGFPKKLLVERTIRDRRYVISDLFFSWFRRYSDVSIARPGRHEVWHGDYREFLASHSGGIGCIYADPPYTIDHYSRFYHVLETVAQYDFPELALKKRNDRWEVMRGHYRTERHQSPFCIPSQAGRAFADLFAGANKFRAPMVLSYSPFTAGNQDRPRLVGLEELTKLAATYFSDVEVIEADGHIHRRLHSTSKNISRLTNSEVFVVCRNR